MGRRLLGGRQAFVLNNIMRIRELIRYGSEGLKNVFQTIPYLLQVNNPKAPGYLPVPDPPRGIVGFERSGFAQSFREAHPDRSLREVLAPNPCIQSLSLIGSTGSVGHTSVSDLDYWVCVDKTELGSEGWTILEAKLKNLSEWARTKRRTEVTFFLMDTEDLRANRLGGLDEDSSGNVMPRLLKEEFYRTLLHVAGRIPLWWVAPPGASQAEYEHISRSLDRIQSTTLHPLDFVDLGFPEKPDPREFLGAAMWQAYKSQRDPFKAVLKMILILEQVEDNNAPLLCDQVKAALGVTPPDELPVDPYIMTIKRVLDFTERRQPQNLELVRFSSWFKLQTPFEPRLSKKENKKGQVLRDLTAAWGWGKKGSRTCITTGIGRSGVDSTWARRSRAFCWTCIRPSPPGCGPISPIRSGWRTTA
ncbi:MAG: class I adenylate cyclase [Pseudomonadota bacterium]